MISREEVEQIGEIVNESKNTYTVKKEDGSTVFVCKYCGTELIQNEMFKHFNPRHTECCEEWLKTYRQQRAEARQQTTGAEKSLTHKRVLTPEEEMIEEMCRILRVQMESTPGVGVGDKTDWFVEQYFRNVRTVQESPQELFKQLKKYFPKADDDAISLIVSNVFKVREEYTRNRNVATFTSTFTPTTMPMSQMQLPSGAGGDGVTQWMFMFLQQMMQQQQQFYQMLLQEARNKVDPDAIRAQVENEYLRRQLERLEEQLNRMTEMLADNSRTRPISPEGWKDDYARLIAEMGDKILNLGERIIIENKNFRKMLIKYLAPKIIGRQELEFEPGGEGKTDEEIIAELEEEGLVEEG